MIPSDPRQFESLVEGLIRPLRITHRRRRALRDELLAHLHQAYEEELSRGLDETTAAKQAIKRFGDPADLQRQLRSSIPWYEPWLFILFNPKETPMSGNPRVIGWTMSLIGGAFMFGLAIVLPATAKVAQAARPDLTADRALDASILLKTSLMSLTAFSALITLTGLSLLAYAFINRKKIAGE